MANTAFVNLSTSKVDIYKTPTDLFKVFLGGRGMGAKYLYDLVGPDVDPLSPGNYLILTCGPFTGTIWPTAARLHVTFKSPLTGIYGYANSGGFFVTEMFRAGYDTILITGKANQPVYLRIIDGDIQIEPADHLWGKPTAETHDLLLGPEHRSDNGRVACIGPAGENLVHIAAIINYYHRAAARGGPGAVMGSKNLKAIHIKASVHPASSPALIGPARKAIQKLQSDSKLDGLRKFGTLMLMDSKNVNGDQPAKNHQFVQVPFINQVNANAFDQYVLEHKGCHACPIKCGRKSRVEKGPYSVELEGPEYETTNALGPMCWLSDPEAIMYANHLCNQFGMDTISTGVTIAFAMELHEKGLLNDSDLSLEWGDPTTVLGLIERIAHRQGIGNSLADGTRQAAKKIGKGADYYAMQVKGLELPRQEPRFAKGFGLGHATSNRGADHLYGMPTIDLSGAVDTARHIFPAAIVPELMNPSNEKYKPDMLVYGEHFCAISDSLGICKFSTVEEYSLFPEDLAPGITALWGEPITGEELLLIGERIVNLERLYNVRQGLGREQDHLPRRFTEESAPLYVYEPDPVSGKMERSEEPFRIGRINDFESMLNRYYDLRGWSRDGIPTLETLKRLGLEHYATGREANINANEYVQI